MCDRFWSRETGLCGQFREIGLIPVQQFDFFGMHWNLVQFTLSIMDRNVESIKDTMETFLSKDNWPARQWLSLQGEYMSIHERGLIAPETGLQDEVELKAQGVE